MDAWKQVREDYVMAPVDEIFRRTLTIFLTVYLAAGIMVIVGLGFAIWAFLRAYVRHRGKCAVNRPVIDIGLASRKSKDDAGKSKEAFKLRAAG